MSKSDVLTELCEAGCRVTVEHREGARKWKYIVYLQWCRRKEPAGGPYYGRTVDEALTVARGALIEPQDPA